MTLLEQEIPTAAGIYKITCKATLKSYVGQSRNIKARIKQHLKSSLNPLAKDFAVPIHAAIRKYGIENFDLSILEFCEPAILNSREMY